MKHEHLKLQIAELLDELSTLKDELDSELNECNNYSVLARLINDLDSIKTVMRSHKYKLKQSKTGLKLV